MIEIHNNQSFIKALASRLGISKHVCTNYMYHGFPKKHKERAERAIELQKKFDEATEKKQVELNERF